MLNNILTYLGTDGLQLLWKVLGIAAILLIAKIIEKISHSIIGRLYEKRAQKAADDKKKRMVTAASVTQSVAKYVIWFFALMAIIGELGLTSTMNSMLATAGIGGVALGIGAQSFIKDVVAGIFFLFDDQMAVGDYVKIDDVSGTVEEIALRNTMVRGFRGEMNIIPNGLINVMVNYSRADYLALVDIQIAYESDAARAKLLMQEEASAYASGEEHTIEPPEVLGVMSLDASGITLRMVMKVKPLTHWATERALLERIKVRFAREGIEIPYPHITVLNREETA